MKPLGVTEAPQIAKTNGDTSFLHSRSQGFNQTVFSKQVSGWILNLQGKGPGWRRTVRVRDWPPGSE